MVRQKRDQGEAPFQCFWFCVNMFLTLLLTIFLIISEDNPELRNTDIWIFLNLNRVKIIEDGTSSYIAGTIITTGLISLTLFFLMKCCNVATYIKADNEGMVEKCFKVKFFPHNHEQLPGVFCTDVEAAIKRRAALQDPDRYTKIYCTCWTYFYWPTRVERARRRAEWQEERARRRAGWHDPDRYTKTFCCCCFYYWPTRVERERIRAWRRSRGERRNDDVELMARRTHGDYLPPQVNRSG